MKQRDLTFDVLKGILILLVVLGHAYQYEYGSVECWRNHVFNFIYTFHMPLFVMISGFFFSTCLKRGFLNNLRRKGKRLVVPWIVVSVITTIVFFTSKEFVPNSLSFSETIVRIYTIFLSLWFLPCIFCLTFFYYILCKIKTSKSYKVVGIILIVLFLYLMVKTSVFGYSKNILESFLSHCQILRHALIFGIGILLFLKRDKIQIKHWIAIDIVAMLIVVINRLHLGIWISEYSFFERILDGICSALLMFSVLKPMCSFLTKSKISNVLAYGGGNSLGIYCLHCVFYRILNWNNNLPRVPSHLSSALLFLGLTMVTVCIIELIKKAFKSKSYFFGV